jgi:MoaA/NifB/PqqE/SkfB family radical SAM enzyme
MVKMNTNRINKKIKIFNSPNYKYIFNRITGVFARWGKTKDDDPEFSPIGPEILDFEVSEICHGGRGGLCRFCYKNSLPHGSNTSFETFKHIIDRMPTVTQIAFGIGDIDGNPDLFEMFEYCLTKDIIPNITINGERMTPEYYDKLVEYCGAVAVSHYNDDACFNAVKELTDRDLKQVNIHQLVSEETYSDCMRLAQKSLTDERLKNLNAIVFLALKQKGRGVNFHTLSEEKFKKIINFCTENNISYGADSCSAHKILNAYKGTEEYDKVLQYVEPCESGLFSAYVNVHGQFFPCSFSEGVDGINGIDLTGDFDFKKDVWFSEQTNTWRNNLLKNKRRCPIYNV